MTLHSEVNLLFSVYENEVHAVYSTVTLCYFFDMQLSVGHCTKVYVTISVAVSLTVDGIMTGYVDLSHAFVADVAHTWCQR